MILTKAAVVKGTPSSWTINKTDLAAAVSGNAYYQDTANWKTVQLIYKSSTGKQRVKVKFDATQGTPSGSFLISEKALESFEVQKIIISDFDGGFFVINRASLTTAQFDVVVTESEDGESLVWTPRSNYTVEPDGGFTTINSDTTASGVIYDDNAIDSTEDFELTYDYSSSGFSPATFIGYANTSKTTFSGLFFGGSGLAVLLNNSEVASGLSMNSGANTLNIKQVGGVLTFKLNGTQIYQTSSIGQTQIIPAARLFGGNASMISATKA